MPEEKEKDSEGEEKGGKEKQEMYFWSETEQLQSACWRPRRVRLIWGDFMPQERRHISPASVSSDSTIREDTPMPVIETEDALLSFDDSERGERDSEMGIFRVIERVKEDEKERDE